MSEEDSNSERRSCPACGAEIPADAPRGLCPKCVLAGAAPARDSYFDREWALALLGRALDRLAGEHESTGKQEQFERLKPWLSGDDPGYSQADAAGELGISGGAIKVAIHRLRKRMRAIVRAEISDTVESEDEISGELNYLIEALS